MKCLSESEQCQPIDVIFWILQLTQHRTCNKHKATWVLTEDQSCYNIVILEPHKVPMTFQTYLTELIITELGILQRHTANCYTFSNHIYNQSSYFLLLNYGSGAKRLKVASYNVRCSHWLKEKKLSFVFKV